MEVVMKPSKIAVGVVALAGLLCAGSASAWGGHHHGPRVSLGFNFGMPYYAPYYYAPYYPAPAYYSSPVIVQSAPQVYTERHDVAPAPDAQNFWHYCASSRGYYPYVKEC